MTSVLVPCAWCGHQARRQPETLQNRREDYNRTSADGVCAKCGHRTNWQVDKSGKITIWKAKERTQA